MADSPTNAQHAATTSEHSLCSMCKNPGTKLCNRCKCSRYCSPACQQSDWPVHKLLCKKLQDFSKRPAENKIRGIYFPFDGPSPTFFWLSTIGSDANPVGRLAIDASTGRLPESLTGQDLMITNVIEKNPVLDRATAAPLMHWQCPHKHFTGQPMNKSLLKIDSELSATTPGPILFHGHGKDLDTSDFRDIIDHLRFAFYEYGMEAEKKMAPPDALQTVRLNCLGDVEICGRPRVEAFPQPLPPYTTWGIIKVGIGDAIGIPLDAGQVKHNLPWRGRKNAEGSEYAFNSSWLHPRLFWGDVGSIMLARKDKKPLLVPHVEALAAYCFELKNGSKFANLDMEDMLAKVKEGKEVETLCARVAAVTEYIDTHASKEGFAEFYKEWQTKDEAKEYRGMPSPSDI